MRKLVFSLGAVVALLVVTLVAALLFLNSAAGSRFILTQAKSYIEKEPGGRFEFSEGRLSALSGLHFKNLKIVFAKTGLKLEALIDSLDLDYAISFWHKRLTVERFELAGARIDYQTEGAAPGPTPAPKASASSLDDLLLSPPLEVLAPNLHIANLSLRFEGRSGGAVTRAEVEGLELQLALEVLPGKLSTQGKLALAKPVSYASEVVTGKMTVLADVDALWKVAVQRESDEWKLKLEQTSVQLGLTDLSLRQPALNVSLPRAKVDLKADASARVGSLAQLKGNSVEAVTVDLKASLSRLEIAQEKSRSSVDSQDIFLEAALSDAISFDLHHTLRGVSSGDLLTRPTGIESAPSAS